MPKSQFILLPGLLLACACSTAPQNVLKGETAYEMKGSIIALARDLPPARRDEFERAVETIILATTDRRLSVSQERLSDQAMQMLKGRTVGQVIESAKLIRTASRSL